MKIPEAIYCMNSYIDDPSNDHCTNCPYYGSVPVENGYICKSGTAHKMAAKALELLENAKHYDIEQLVTAVRSFYATEQE